MPIVRITRKTGSVIVKLYVDGKLVGTRNMDSWFPASALPRELRFGLFSGTVNHVFTWATVQVNPAQNFWNLKDDNGDTPSSDTLHTATSPFVSGDVGKNLVIHEGTPPSNRGEFVVATVPASNSVTLVGPERPNASVDSGNPTRITVPANGKLFRYPDDIGKKIKLSNSGLGNDGEWAITRLLQAGTLADLDGFDTPVDEQTNVCEVTGPTFTSETGLTWQLNPNFVVDPSGVEWELAEAGSVVAQVATMRGGLGIPDAGFQHLVDVVYTQVLTGQALLDNTIQNVLIQDSPALLFAYYPFYIADPLGFVRTYASAITAAGVIPDFLIE